MSTASSIPSLSGSGERLFDGFIENHVSGELYALVQQLSKTGRAGVAPRRSAEILEYLVKRRFGQQKPPTEYDIAFDVFHRNSSTFDPKTDSFVRRATSQLRKGFGEML